MLYRDPCAIFLWEILALPTKTELQKEITNRMNLQWMLHGRDCLQNECLWPVTARYIYSNLTLGQEVGGVSTKAGQSVAADLSMYYTKPLKISGVAKSNFSVGANISNIGAKNCIYRNNP